MDIIPFWRHMEHIYTLPFPDNKPNPVLPPLFNINLFSPIPNVEGQTKNFAWSGS